MAQRQKVELTGGETLTVCSKVPMGLRLYLHEFVEERQIGPGGVMHTARVARKVGEPVIINGPSRSYFDADARRGIDFDIEGGWALTPGVPAAFWQLFCEQNAGSDLIKNKLIFAADPASTKSWAREHEKLRSGWEPLDANDPSKRGFGKDRLKVERGPD